MYLLYKIYNEKDINSDTIGSNKILGVIGHLDGFNQYAQFLVNKFGYTIVNDMNRNIIEMKDKNDTTEFLCSKQVVNLDERKIFENSTKTKKQLLLKDNDQLDAIINHLNNNNDYFKNNNKNFNMKDYRSQAAKQDINTTKIIDQERLKNLEKTL